MVKVFVKVLGKTMNSHVKFLDDLMRSTKIHEVNSEEVCEVILAFVPIVSRAGTDIEAALQQIPEGRRVVLVVLHHTFDPDSVFPTRRENVRRRNVFIVDCLFHEDRGLLRCSSNDAALKDVKDYLKAIHEAPENEVKLYLKEDSPLQSRPSKNKVVWKNLLLVAVAVVVLVIVCIVIVYLVKGKK